READRRNGRISPERRRREVGQLPVLLGDQAYPGGKPAHAEEQRCRSDLVRGDELLLAAFGRQRRPQMTCAFVRGRPRMAVALAVAVAVSVLAVPAAPAGAGVVDGRVGATAGSGGAGSGACAESSRSRTSWGRPASMPSRWSSVGPPLPTLYAIAAFGSPVFDRRMK